MNYLAQGNKTISTFWSGFASSAISPFRSHVAGDNYNENIAFNAISSGTISEISGGKFANDAVLFICLIWRVIVEIIMLLKKAYMVNRVGKAQILHGTDAQ